MPTQTVELAHDEPILGSDGPDVRARQHVSTEGAGDELVAVGPGPRRPPPSPAHLVIARESIRERSSERDRGCRRPDVVRKGHRRRAGRAGWVWRSPPGPDAVSAMAVGREPRRPGDRHPIGNRKATSLPPRPSKLRGSAVPPVPHVWKTMTVQPELTELLATDVGRRAERAGGVAGTGSKVRTPWPAWWSSSWCPGRSGWTPNPSSAWPTAPSSGSSCSPAAQFRAAAVRISGSSKHRTSGSAPSSSWRASGRPLIAVRPPTTFGSSSI